MGKSDVNGEKANDVYKILRIKSSLFNKTSRLTKEVPWNFTKFIVSADLQVIEFISPSVDPKDIFPKIEELLLSEIVVKKQ